MGCKLAIAEIACKTMQLSTCWNNDRYGLDLWSTANTVVGEALISQECSCSGCSALDLGIDMHDSEEDPLLGRLSAIITCVVLMLVGSEDINYVIYIRISIKHPSKQTYVISPTDLVNTGNDGVF